MTAKFQKKKITMPKKNYINVEITYPPNDRPSDTCSRSNVPLTKYLSVTHEITYPPISGLICPLVLSLADCLGVPSHGHSIKSS
jgi:hypothetical protein